MLIILCVLIVGHEFGHFAVAKLNGICVEEFSLGMGPKLLQWGSGETKYSIRALPIGGYVKMDGENEASNNERAFCNKGVLARMSVVFAGPFMNFVMAILLFIIAFMYYGVPASNTLVGEVEAGKPAAVAGVMVGDVITAVDGVETANYTELIAQMQQNLDGEMELTVLRDGETLTLAMTPELVDGSYVIGITQGIMQMDLLGSVKLGFTQTLSFSILLIEALGDMITGEMDVEVSGPIGMVGVVGSYADTGLMSLFLLAGILSINLGIMNLLPIPALDGSRLVFLTIEALRGKPIDPNKEAAINFAGFAFLMSLTLVVAFMDLSKIFG